MDTKPPIPSPNTEAQDSTPVQTANSHELREWLGITPADFLIYAALALGGSLYLVRNLPVEILLSIVAVILALASCVLGMPHDERVSQATNWVKKVSYPACVIILLVLLYLNFTTWNLS